MMHASIGFRSKTARAIAIALTQTKSSPAYLARWELSLYDPRVPATGQPHHEVMELPWSDAQIAVQRFEQRIETVATDVFAKLLSELRSKGYFVGSVGVVGSPDRKLDKIGNPHIRAHAAEGILFRRVLEVAASKHGLQCRVFSDRNVDALPTSELGRNSEGIQDTLAAIGRAAGKPWRADERFAATAAWLMLKEEGSLEGRLDKS